MQIGVQARGFDLTEALREYCERRLRFAFVSGSDKVGSVLIRLTDQNGPRGGVDKRCSVRIILRDAPAVVIVQDEADLYAAIDRAADRAGRAISRQLEKSWSVRRSPGLVRRDKRSMDSLEYLSA